MRLQIKLKLWMVLGLGLPHVPEIDFVLWVSMIYYSQGLVHEYTAPNNCYSIELLNFHCPYRIHEGRHCSEEGLILDLAPRDPFFEYLKTDRECALARLD